MRYTNYLGVVFALGLIITSFLPWVYIQPLHLEVTGLHTTGTQLGKPAVMNIVMAVVAAILFLSPFITAKRINLFVGAFNLAWAVRNYFVVTLCQMGECPEKKIGIYLLIIFSILLLAMALFPKVDLKDTVE